jgi:integrase
MQSMAGKTWNRTGVNNLWRHSNGRYYARFSRGGKESWQSLKTKLITVARERLAVLLKEVRAGAGSGDVGDPKTTFGQLIEAKLAEIEARSTKTLKDSTKKYYRECIDAIRATWEGIDEIQIRKAKPTDFEVWANRSADRYCSTRHNNMIAMMRSLVSAAREMGVIFNDPTEKLKRVRIEDTRMPEFPDIETFEKWISLIEMPVGRGGKGSGQALRFLAYSGLRRLTEAQWVRWADVDFEGGWLYVKGDPNNSGTKNRKERKVPLNPALRELLEAMRKEREGEPDTEKVLPVLDAKKAMDRAADEIGMPRLTQADLRKWFTTRCVESRIPIPTVATWLGHQDGGALLMKTYNKQRDEHSQSVALTVSF